MTLTKIELKEFATGLKKIKYQNVLHEVKLEYCKDDDGTVYINVNTIKIKKAERCKGYGNIIMQDIIRFANSHNVRIELYASIIFGSEICRLIKFYEKLGFVKVIEDKDNLMIHSFN